MGRLAGFRYREIVKRLKQLGFEFDRQVAGSHEIWRNPHTNCYTAIPNYSGDLCRKGRYGLSLGRPTSRQRCF